jgi:hypothetical protein
MIKYKNPSKRFEKTRSSSLKTEEKMSLPILASWTFLVTVAVVRGECPNISELPIMYDEETFMCTYMFQGKGSFNPLQV